MPGEMPPPPAPQAVSDAHAPARLLVLQSVPPTEMSTHRLPDSLIFRTPRGNIPGGRETVLSLGRELLEIRISGFGSTGVHLHDQPMVAVNGLAVAIALRWPSRSIRYTSPGSPAPSHAQPWVISIVCSVSSQPSQTGNSCWSRRSKGASPVHGWFDRLRVIRRQVGQVGSRILEQSQIGPRRSAPCLRSKPRACRCPGMTPTDRAGHPVRTWFPGPTPALFLISLGWGIE